MKLGNFSVHKNAFDSLGEQCSFNLTGVKNHFIVTEVKFLKLFQQPKFLHVHDMIIRRPYIILENLSRHITN